MPLKGVKLRVEPADGNSIQSPREGTTGSGGESTITSLLPGEYRGTATLQGKKLVTVLFNVTAGSLEGVKTVMEEEGGAEEP